MPPITSNRSGIMSTVPFNFCYPSSILYRIVLSCTAILYPIHIHELNRCIHITHTRYYLRALLLLFLLLFHSFYFIYTLVVGTKKNLIKESLWVKNERPYASCNVLFFISNYSCTDFFLLPINSSTSFL